MRRTFKGRPNVRSWREMWVCGPIPMWFGRNRRLAKDFENLAETLATFVTLASIQLALRRLARA
jgi:transposase